MRPPLITINRDEKLHFVFGETTARVNFIEAIFAGSIEHHHTSEDMKPGGARAGRQAGALQTRLRETWGLRIPQQRILYICTLIGI